MAEPLKYMYNDTFFGLLTRSMKKIDPSFNSAKFLKSIYTKEWDHYELKQRVRHVTICLSEQMGNNFKNSCELLFKLISELESKGRSQGFEYMFLPDYIELYGQEDVETSIKAFEKITQFVSCEFAVRKFIDRHQDRMLKQMLIWSKHKNHHVRRFASEGCRPRLPWGMALSKLKINPLPILPILENLKNDDSEYVRKSVANNLNDIAKDHPDLVLQLIKKWKGQSKNTDWIIKHGSRTLLKKANEKVLSEFGWSTKINASVKKLNLEKNKLKIGSGTNFSFDLSHKEKKQSALRLEYALYYMKSNGKQNKKIFKISENKFEPNKIYTFKRKISFKDLTTRKHYPGEHKIAIVVNGSSMAEINFTLIK